MFDRVRLLSVVTAMGLGLLATAVNARAAARTNAVLLEIEGRVAVSRLGSTEWDPGRTNQVLRPGDRVQTDENSRAVLRLASQAHLRLGPSSRIRIPDAQADGGAMQLLRGLLYYFHRDKPGTVPVKTPTAYAVTLGTEFAVEVADNGATRIDLLEGRVRLTNEFSPLAPLELVTGEAAIVAPQAAPQRIPLLTALGAIQWVLHYPIVIDPDELQLSDADRQALARALAAYRAGALGEALEQVETLPAGTAGTTSLESRIFRAALRLSVGDVPGTESLLGPIEGDPARSAAVTVAAAALRTLIGAVQFQSGRWTGSVDNLNRVEGFTNSVSALMAASYWEQARSRLAEARAIGRRAVVVAPNFGPGWARLAELEFGHGAREAAGHAVDRAIALSPRHAAAWALRGFVLAGSGRIGRARAAFESALAHDGSLGQAWLGRGLCRIRLGDRDGGREDLMTAVTVEPQRALYRSYLGKAFADGWPADLALAAHELDLARELDPGDPTGWLYSALLARDRHRVNRSIRELERAVALNDGRLVYRSRQMVDQDEAVQGANLAGVYADAGLTDWSVAQAGRAVQLDPANATAHLFLAESHQRLRDPGRVSQRHETAAVSEYLLANLLSPIGAGTLASSVTAQEYSRLFATDGPGIVSSTEYLSRGAWMQSVVQHGALGPSAYAVSGFYRTDPGQRPNHDSEQHELSAQFKHQWTASDRLYFQAVQGEIDGGDLRALENPGRANRSLRAAEEQSPLLLAGYDHEWGPGQHTLALAGWIAGAQSVRNSEQGTLVVDKSDDGTHAAYALPAIADQRYRARLELFTAELQQLWTGARQSLIVGGRYQDGSVDVRNAATTLTGTSLAPSAIGSSQMESGLRRASGYAYHQLEAWTSLWLVTGFSYDWLEYPDNFRLAPVTDGERETRRAAPKGGVVWQPDTRTTVRAGYAQSLGGVGFDQSLRLEPTQVAGFNQAFRSLIPESLAGANSAATFETASASLERRIGRGTFLAFAGEWLRSGVERSIGVYDFVATAQPALQPSLTRERLASTEQALGLSAHQLLGEEWSFGLRYRVSRAELEGHFVDLPATPAVPAPPAVNARSRATSWLHQARLEARYHHPSGVLGLLEAVWHREAGGDSFRLGTADEDVWQVNAWLGWRGWRRRVELRAGVLNLLDRDYRLTPLHLTGELPRERLFAAGARVQF